MELNRIRFLVVLCGYADNRFTSYHQVRWLKTYEWHSSELPLDNRALVRRERAATTYRATTSFASRVLVGLIQPLCAILLGSICLYWAVGLKTSAEHFFIYVGCLALFIIAANFLSVWLDSVSVAYSLKMLEKRSDSFVDGRGTMIGSMVPTAFVGQTIAPLIILVMLVFGGQLINLKSVSSALSWLRWVSLIRYTYSAITQNEFSGLIFNCTGPGCYPTGQLVIKAFFLDECSIIVNVIITAVMGAVYLGCAYVAFELRTRPHLKLK